MLLIGAGAFFSGVGSVAPGVLLMGALLALLWLFRRAPKIILVVSLLAAASGAVRARSAVAEFDRRLAIARDTVGPFARCALWGVVKTSPEWRNGSLRYLAQISGVDCGKGKVGFEGVARLYGGPSGLARGDQFEAIGQLGPPQLFRNLDQDDPRPGAARSGTVLTGGIMSLEITQKGGSIFSWVDGARARVRARILATFSPEAQPLARALVLGENDLEPEDDQAFKYSGLAHLLAVSGTHLVFAVVMFTRALRAIFIRVGWLARRFDMSRVVATVGALAALFYADFAGGSGSAFRAAWMLLVVFIARAIGRKHQVGRVLGLTMALGALFDPLVIFDISFLLSLAATTGLILWARSQEQKGEKSLAPRTWRSNFVVRFVADGSRATVAALIPCVPILALLSDRMSLLGVGGNLVAAPVGELVGLPVCLLHAVSGSLPWLEKGLATLGSGALIFVLRVARLTAEQTWFSLPMPFPTAVHRLLVLGALLAWALWARGSPTSSRAPCIRRGALVLGGTALSLLLVEGLTQLRTKPKNLLRITTLDVGQGDAALVDLPDGRLMLIDGGGFVGSPIDPGRAVILPALRARRRQAVDVMVLSHPHPDHFMGLITVASEVRVHEFWTTSEGESHKVGPYLELVRVLRAQGTRIRYPGELCQGPHFAAKATVEVLAPCPDFKPSWNANDNSLVLKIRYGRHVALSIGDAEHTQEHELAQRFGSSLEADWLKVGHHGSRTSSTQEFLEIVRPKLSVVSSGLRNRFGHPHPEALERLQAKSLMILRTDLHGSVVWETNGEQSHLRVFEPDPRLPRSMSPARLQNVPEERHDHGKRPTGAESFEARE